MARLLTVYQIREITHKHLGYSSLIFIVREEALRLGLPHGWVSMSNTCLWDMDAQRWVRPEDVPPAAPEALSATWQPAGRSDRYVRSDGAVLGEVVENYDKTFAVEIQTGWTREDDLYKARPVRLWTSMSAARAEVERVCRALGLAS